jgi:hypothetical protein
MKKGKKVKEITKYGYVKSIKGEVAVDIQTEHLINNGVLVDHIYNGDGTETIFDAIASLEYDEDQVVIYSGAVLGRWNLKKLMLKMAGLKNTLYNCKSGKDIHFNEGKEIASLIADMEDAERRNGGKGGKPYSISLKDHKRIHKMRDDGMNAREMCEALGWDYKKRGTTVWRCTWRDLPTKANREKK